MLDQADQVRNGRKSVYDSEDVEVVMDELGGDDLDYNGYVINHTNSKFWAKLVKDNDKYLTDYCCITMFI